MKTAKVWKPLQASSCEHRTCCFWHESVGQRVCNCVCSLAYTYSATMALIIHSSHFGMPFAFNFFLGGWLSCERTQSGQGPSSRYLFRFCLAYRSASRNPSSVHGNTLLQTQGCRSYTSFARRTTSAFPNTCTSSSFFPSVLLHKEQNASLICAFQVETAFFHKMF